MKIDGGCYCGYLSFEGEADPDKTTICHCTDCQALTGSAYRVSVPAASESLSVRTGSPKIHVKTAENGAKRAQAPDPPSLAGRPVATPTAARSSA